MFRKTTLLVGALALMLAAPQAHAAKGDVMLGVGGGALLPMSDFKDVCKVGFLGGVDVDYMVTEAVAIGVDGMFAKNDVKDDVKTALGATSADNTFFSGGGHIKYMFPMSGESKLMPYVVGGGGVYHDKFKIEGGSFAGESTENKFGGRGGAGLNIKAGEKVSVNIEGAFVVVSTTGTSTKFVTARAGVSFPLTAGK